LPVEKNFHTLIKKDFTTKKIYEPIIS